VFIVLRHVVL